MALTAEYSSHGGSHGDPTILPFRRPEGLAGYASASMVEREMLAFLARKERQVGSAADVPGFKDDVFQMPQSLYVPRIEYTLEDAQILGKYQELLASKFGITHPYFEFAGQADPMFGFHNLIPFNPEQGIYFSMQTFNRGSSKSDRAQVLPRNLGAVIIDTQTDIYTNRSTMGQFLENNSASTDEGLCQQELLIATLLAANRNDVYITFLHFPKIKNKKPEESITRDHLDTVVPLTGARVTFGEGTRRLHAGEVTSTLPPFQSLNIENGDAVLNNYMIHDPAVRGYTSANSAERARRPRPLGSYSQRNVAVFGRFFSQETATWEKLGLLSAKGLSHAVIAYLGVAAEMYAPSSHTPRLALYDTHVTSIVKLMRRFGGKVFADGEAVRATRPILDSVLNSHYAAYVNEVVLMIGTLHDHLKESRRVLADKFTLPREFYGKKPRGAK